MTILIVTHNMQQAARVSDYTAFMYLGELVEFDDTAKIFTNPTQEGDRRLHHRPLRLTGASLGSRALPLVLRFHLSSLVASRIERSQR